MTIRKLLSSRRAFRSQTCVVALFAASLAACGSAFGQGFGTTFDEGTGTYPQPRGSLSGQNNWDTNDGRANNTTPVGQSDYVGPVDGYTGSSTTNYQGGLGGLYHSSGELPGKSTVYLYHAASPGSASTYVFNTDFDISFPAAGTAGESYTRDSFGFNFQTTALSNLFSVNFTPDLSGNNNSVNQMVIGTSVNNSANNPTVNAILYNSIYHLQLSVNVPGRMMTVAITGTNNYNFTISLASVDPASVQQIAATWVLSNTSGVDANGGYTNAGSNAIIFDNFALTVPEPSTWAMLGLGVVAGGLLLRRRARA